MIKLTLALTLALTFTAQAEAIECKQLKTLAKTVMQARQDGMPLARILKKTDSPVIKELINKAYSKPVYQFKASQRATRDFVRSTALACGKGE